MAHYQGEPGFLAWADSVDAGLASAYSPGNPPPLATTVQTETGLDVGDVGVSSNLAREDHRHPITGLVDTSSAQTITAAKTLTPGNPSTTYDGAPGVGAGNWVNPAMLLSPSQVADATNVVIQPFLNFRPRFWTGTASSSTDVHIKASVTGTSGATALIYDANSHYLVGTVNTAGNLSENGNRVYSSANPPPYPVTSVAGRTGAVTLGAADVGTGTFPTGSFTFVNQQNFTGDQVLHIALQDTHAGQATPKKYLRSFSGQFQIVNDANSAVLFSVTDAGLVNTAGNLQENGNRVYSAGNTPPYPVTSVAGRTGAVTLTAADIPAGAFPGAMTAPTFEATGTTAALYFDARNGARNWAWYSQTGTAQLYNGTSDVFTVDASGNINSVGTVSEAGSRVYSPNNTPPYPVTSVAGLTGAVAIGQGFIGGWRQGATSGTTISATTTETAIFSGISATNGSFTFVSGRRYRLNLLIGGNATTASTTTRLIVGVRVGSGTGGARIGTGSIPCASSAFQSFNYQTEISCPGDVPSGTQTFSICGQFSASNTWTSLGANGELGAQNKLWFEDLGT